jgi:hypothetical protein
LPLPRQTPRQGGGVCDGRDGKAFKEREEGEQERLATGHPRDRTVATIMKNTPEFRVEVLRNLREYVAIKDSIIKNKRRGRAEEMERLADIFLWLRDQHSDMAAVYAFDGLFATITYRTMNIQKSQPSVVYLT